MYIITNFNFHPLKFLLYLNELFFPTIDSKHFVPLIECFSCPHLCIGYCLTICIAPLTAFENELNFSVSKIIHGVVNNFTSD